MDERTSHGKAQGRIEPITLLAGFATLTVCQLTGEVCVQAIRLIAPAFAFPGPVAGMFLLLGLLVLRRGLDPGTDAVAAGLIGILPLLFVPSAVGVIQYGDVLIAWGGPLLVAVVVSTLATLLMTVGTFLLIAKLTEGR